MSAVDQVQRISGAFLWPSKEAMPLMREAIKKDSCCSSIKARVFFVTQVIASMVAIPFMLIASLFITLWNLAQCDIKNAGLTLPTAIIQCGYHVGFIFGSIIGSVAPMSLTDKTLDCFEFERVVIPTGHSLIHTETAQQNPIEPEIRHA